MWHFATKCAGVKFAKPWISSHFSEWRDPSLVRSAMCPECPRKDWRDQSCWLHPRDSGPEIVQGPGVLITLPTRLGPVLVWSHQTWDYWKPWSISSPRVTACNPPERKTGYENERMILKYAHHFIVCFISFIYCDKLLLFWSESSIFFHACDFVKSKSYQHIFTNQVFVLFRLCAVSGSFVDLCQSWFELDACIN